MYLRNRNNTDNTSWNNTTWMHDVSLRREKIFNDIQSLRLNLQDKKILCVAGGIGRNANSLADLECDVTNSDIVPSYIALGKKHYPNIKHIVYDYTQEPLQGYDYVLFESFYVNWYNWHMYSVAKKWSEFANVLPRKINCKIYRFDSVELDRRYSQEEQVGSNWIKHQYGTADIEGIIYKSQTQNLIESQIQFDVLNPSMTIGSCDTHTYQMIGTDDLSIEGMFKGVFINRGLQIGFTKNKTFQVKNVAHAWPM